MSAASDTSVIRFSIGFDRWYGLLSRLLGLHPSRAYLELREEEVEARMGWAFRSRFPRSAITSVSVLDAHPMSRGVHGWGGRWLVNGSGRGIVSIRLDPVQRAYVMGLPVRLRELLVSVAEPSALTRTLGGSTAEPH
jgi:hypothetical protein